jgi:serine/threonine protein kinase
MTPVSEDHGCGSTFYMSPECLDQSSRNTSYRCAPNDIWSLGVILVNLTCGRNPWKQASVEDSTYKAFTRNRDFLKTILPLSDELNDILGMIFESDPKQRIDVTELKQRIFQCSSFSAPIQQASLPTPPQSPCSFTEDVFEDSLSDDGSVSDDGSLTGSCSTVSDTDSEASYDGCDITSYTVQRTTSQADSGYESVEETISKPTPQSAAIVNSEVPRVQQRSAIPAPCTPSYVLPQAQEYTNPWGVAKVQPNPNANPWYQSWNSNPYEHQYEQVHAVSNVHIPSYPHPAFYASHYQYGQAAWV